MSLRLTVDDDDQPFFMSDGRGRVKRSKTRRTIRLVKCRLKLDHGDQGSDDVDHVAAERQQRLGDAVGVTGKSFQESGGQFLGPGVDSDDHRVADSTNRLE